jgi:outer membrane protein assembly factor BamB
MTKQQRALLTVGAVLAAAALAHVRTDENSTGWLQWGGPDRNFRVTTSGLASSWPDGGPKRLWTRALGDGYSSVLVAGDWLYTMYRDGDTDVIVGLTAATGETRWEHRHEAPYADDMDAGAWLRGGGKGPFSTPLVLGDTIYAVGVTAKFFAIDRHTGKVRWSRDLVDQFDLTGYRAYAPSPLAYGDTIILPVGGRGQAVVAFDQQTGAVDWKSGDFGLAPSSPCLIDVDGQEQLVIFAPQEIVGFDPANGRRLWSHPHETGYGLAISTPVWSEGNLLFISSAYGGGSRVLHLSQAGGRTTVKELWHNNRLRLHFGNAMRVGDLMLLASGDFGPAFFAAVDVRTGEELWRERTFGRSQMVYADGKLLVVDEDGDLSLATATAEGLRVHARSALLTSNAWTPPTLVGTTLYLRDRKSLMAVDLRP